MWKIPIPSHTLCHLSTETTKGGGAGKAVFIDTEGTFRPERLIPICQRFNVDPDIVLDNIVYARAYHIEQQLSLLQECLSIINNDTVSFLAIDSISALYRSCTADGMNIVERQQHLTKFLKELLSLAVKRTL
ncbi:hypothetical protein GEMRC1_003448 [Eukaryota sp. GEM-RC1]